MYATILKYGTPGHSGRNKFKVTVDDHDTKKSHEYVITNATSSKHAGWIALKRHEKAFPDSRHISANGMKTVQLD